MIYKESESLNKFTYIILSNFEFVESRKCKCSSKTFIFPPNLLPLRLECPELPQHSPPTRSAPPHPMHLELIFFDDKVITEFLEELDLGCCEIRNVYPDSIRMVVCRLPSLDGPLYYGVGCNSVVRSDRADFYSVVSFRLLVCKVSDTKSETLMP